MSGIEKEVPIENTTQDPQPEPQYPQPEPQEWIPLKDFPDFEVNTKTEEIRDISTKQIKEPFQRSDKRYLIQLGSNIPYYYRVKAKQFLPNPWNYTEVDHIDRNLDNNSLGNLRFASRTLNNMNRNLERYEIVHELPQDSYLITEFGTWKFHEPGIDYSYHFSSSAQSVYLQLTPTTFRKVTNTKGYVSLRDVSGVRRRIKLSNFL